MAIPAGARVLIVEDEVFISLTLEDMMRDLGLVIGGVAHDIAGALALVEGPQVFDLASLDVNLGGKNSEAVAVALTARAAIQFIGTTGYDSHYLPAAFQERPLLQKPFELDAVAEAVTALGLNRKAYCNPRRGRKSPAGGWRYAGFPAWTSDQGA
jgi:CheY-like chemotaxis protein